MRTWKRSILVGSLVAAGVGSLLAQRGGGPTPNAKPGGNGGVLALPNTTSSTNGVLTVGGDTFLHRYGGATNAFVGTGARNFGMTGTMNTALGTNVLNSNTSGEFNTAAGWNALQFNTGGSENTANGAHALWSNTTGSNNTAFGFRALLYSTTAIGNTGIGWLALASNVSGTGNTAVGIDALEFVEGRNNIGIGAGAGFALHGVHDYNIYIGNAGVNGEDGAIRIGDSSVNASTFIAGINGATAASGLAVYVNASGQLGTLTSSRRYKYDIHDMDETTKNLLRLRPVTFRYKQAQDNGSHPLQYGLIAEEVAEVYPELVQSTPGGEPNAVFYQFLPAMLLKEFQKQHRQIEAQQEQIQSLLEQLQQLADQTRQLQTELVALRARGERANEVAVLHPQP